MGNLKWELLSATLDLLNAGVILLRTDGKVIHTNSIAADILSNKTTITISNGILQGSNKSISTSIRKTIADVSQSSTEGTVEICLKRATSQSGAVIGSFRLLNCSDRDGPVIALFLLKGDDANSSHIACVAQSYDLTRAQTRTLEQIACGHVIADAAKERVVSKNTVKTHLQKIFEKTGTSRQTDLIRLVYAYRAPLRDPSPPYRI